jgi:hypothetical protein
MQMIGRKIVIMFLAAVAVVLFCGSAMAAGWTLTDLSAQGNIMQCAASSINNNGDIVGRSQFIGSTYEHATLCVRPWRSWPLAEKVFPDLDPCHEVVYRGKWHDKPGSPGRRCWQQSELNSQ